MNALMTRHDTTLSVRDKILLTAHDLFYSSGFKATGVDTIIKQARVTKVTFYRHFPAKNLLILAYLHYRHDMWMSWFKTTLRLNGEQGKTPAEALSATLQAWFVSPCFYGCAFINASAEAKSEDIENDIKEICREHKTETGEIVASLFGLTDKNVIRELMLLIDGAIIHAQMGMNPDEIIDPLKKGIEKLTGGDGFNQLRE